MISLNKFANRIRRETNKLINRNYVQNKLKNRKGNCKRCGKCCVGCKYFDKKTKLCLVYNNRPWFCYKEFPLDDLDQKVFRVKYCRYVFNK